MNSAHVSHPDFTCVTSPDGLLKWKCSLCGNFLSSKQWVISHLIRTHGKTNFLEQEQKQTLNSRTTLWRRKRSANGCFVPEQSSSTVSFEERLSFNSEHCSSILYELPVPEGASSASSLSQSSSKKKLNVSLSQWHLGENSAIQKHTKLLFEYQGHCWWNSIQEIQGKWRISYQRGQFNFTF